MTNKDDSSATQHQIPKSNELPARPQVPSEVTAAAQKIGRLIKTKFKGRRRVKRKWTGYLAGERCWHGRKVVLLDGRLAFLECAQRGMAKIWIDEGGPIARYTVPSRSLRLYKNTDAILLGRGKLGATEVKSEKKAVAARANGKMPVHPGYRRRGRPRKNAPDWRKFELRASRNLPANASIDSLLKIVVLQRAETDAAIAAAKIKDEANRERAQRRHQLKRSQQEGSA